MSKTLLVNEEENKVLSRLVSVLPRVIPNQVKNTALDGTPHIQTIGEPEKELFVTAYVKKNDMALLNQAWAETGLVSVTINKIKKYGYITNVAFGERMPQGWYPAEITMSEVDVL